MQTTEPRHTFWNKGLLVACVALPWLNPFASSPSTAVIPLLLSWMLSACALLLVVDMPVATTIVSLRKRGWAVLLGVWLLALLCFVPPVIDRALTAGLLAALLCVWLMVQVGRRAATDERLFTCLVFAVLLAAVVSSVLGMLQYLGWAQALSPWVNQPLRGDAFANLRQRNQFASLTALGLAALLGGVIMRRRANPMSRAAWVCMGISLNVLAAGVAVSVSRTGAMAWLVVPAVMALWAWRYAPKAERHRAWGLTVAAPLAVVVWSVVMPWWSLLTTGEWGASLLLRVAGETHDYAACGGRRVLWANVLTLLAQQPWFGWGWGETDYAHFMTHYSDMRFCDMLDNAHDLPLHLALEFGVPFAVVVLLCLAAWVWQRRPWQESEASRVMAWCWLLVLGMHSLLEYPLWYGPFQMTLGLAIGLLGWPIAAENPASTPVRPMLVAALLFIGCLYAAWDFNRVGQIYRQPASRDAAYSDNPLAHAKQSWLFKNQAEFAELTTQTVTAENAKDIYPQARRLMHYSPEARVVQRAIDSGLLLGYEEEAQALTLRLEEVKKSMPR